MSNITLHPTIGLEIHIKLATSTKLFCSCTNEQEFGSLEANTHVCPTCMGHPGALPVLQREPLEKAILLGCVLGCTINNHSQFDRKSYFYPDLPLGYQITQLYRPLNTDGEVTFFIDQYQTTRTVRIQQAHVETDTGKTIHDGDRGLIDYNRAGSPLIEIVTRPDFHDALEVSEFLKELQRTLRYNHISDADLEKGQMRCDVNISLAPEGSPVLGTRVELKNINSFGAVRRAITAEIERQTAIISQGGTIDQETRRRDDETGQSISMRSKADALDYRYFPDPDLPPVEIEPGLVERMRAQVQSTGTQRILRYRDDYGFHKEYINGLLTDSATTIYFEQLVSRGYEPKLVAKRICGPIAAYMTKHLKDIISLPFEQSAFMVFLDRIVDQTISDHQAKIIMELMLEGNDDVDGLIQSKGFGKQEIDADSLRVTIQDVLAQHSHVVAEYRGGKVAVLGFLLGAVMKATGGSISPQDARAMLLECLG